MKLSKHTIAGAAIAIGLMASVSHAQAQQDPEVKKLFTQLKNIPRGQGAPSKVRSLTLRLVRLDPEKAVSYFRQARQRFATAFVIRELNRLNPQVTRIVTKSDVRNPNGINRRIDNLTPPPPGTGPYQAGLTPSVIPVG